MRYVALAFLLSGCATLNALTREDLQRGEENGSNDCIRTTGSGFDAQCLCSEAKNGVRKCTYKIEFFDEQFVNENMRKKRFLWGQGDLPSTGTHYESDLAQGIMLADAKKTAQGILRAEAAK